MKRLWIFSFSLLVLFSAGCSSTQTTPLSKLMGKPWVLSSISGQAPDLVKFSSGLPTLNFLEGEAFAGFAGCNNFSGEYTLTGSEIKLNPGAMTRKTCPGSGERDFLSALEKVKTLSFDKEKLTLLDGATELMSFSSKKD